MSTGPKFETTDIVLAAALKELGVELDGMKLETPSDRYKRGRVIFVFSDLDKAKEYARDHYAGKLKVSSLSFVSKLKEFKHMVFNKESLGRN